MKRIIISSLILVVSLLCPLAAQETATMALLHDSPYRHNTNPAYMPSTNGYVILPFLSRNALSVGNNTFTLSDWITSVDGKTMLTLHPESPIRPTDALHGPMLLRVSMDNALLGVGFHTKNSSYYYIDVYQHSEGGAVVPDDLFRMALGGGMPEPEGNNLFNLSSLGASGQTYTALSIGYAHQKNDKWTWGFKVKFLLGQLYTGINTKNLDLQAGIDRWQLTGEGNIYMAGPLEAQRMPESIQFAGENPFALSEYLPEGYGQNIGTTIKESLTPRGLGAAFDLGVTYQPIRPITLSLALTDIGFIRWHKGINYACNVNGEFEGAGVLNYSDYVDEKNHIDLNRVGDTISERLLTTLQYAATTQKLERGAFISPLTMRLHAGVEANLVHDIIGLGLYSNTMLFQSRLYEELTFGLAIRPSSWLNLAASYSFINGRFSNIGAGLTLRGGPFVLTVATDYVPLIYAAPRHDEPAYIPYKTKGINVELGLAIVWGWQKGRLKQIREAKRAAAEDAL